MADTTDTSILDTEADDGAQDESGAEQWYASVAAKYEAEDAAGVRSEDGIEDEAAHDEQDAEDGADDADGTEEDPKAGTSSDDSDGSEDESEAGSTDDDETDHTEGDESEESEESGEAEAEGAEDGEDDTEEAGVSDETKALLAGKGADLTIEDVPQEYRPIVEKKLRGIDAAFTRIAQEATAFRRDRTQFEAEQRFRQENPALVIVEMLQAHPELFDEVNAQFDKLDDATQAEAFKIVVKDKRESAVKAVESQYSEEERLYNRAVEVETTAKSLAAKANLPWRLAERAVEAALLRKPAESRDLTDAELQQVIADEAKAYQQETRATTRAASKTLVQQRAAAKKAAPPAAKKPASAASPRPVAKKARPLNHDSEEARQARMMETARRIIPGVRDQ